MAVAPTGTVTFLFTDIEGSTLLWELHPEVMESALERHDHLIRTAIERNDGYVFKTVGDAFCAVFASPHDSLGAAICAQTAVISEPWPDPLSIKVRMALHTGSCTVRGGDYFGRALNRVSRMLSIGHGGQILVSAATHELILDSIQNFCSVESLGEHRMRDLGAPEPIYQVIHPNLPDAFPPLRSLSNPKLPNNLPRQLTSFVGREKEIADVNRLLHKANLLTLVGAGGSGKTRLGLQVGADALETTRDGVWFVALASILEGSLVAATVAQALGISEKSGEGFEETLVQHLEDRQLLLLLDNCEHVLPECARLAAALMLNCPNVKVLATSREALGIGGEQTYRVPSLSLPDPKGRFSIAAILDCEAVRLFAERALMVKNDFEVTPENARALAQICARLDGIPLAIELASARVRTMPIKEINARLDNRFRLLIGGDRTALPRHQTLRALIDWSYELLNSAEKGLLTRLSVFSGGWTLEGAERLGVGEDVEDWEVLDLLTSLADKSLVIVEEDLGEGRYRMLETVRQYGSERLTESSEIEPLRSRHAEIFLALAEEAEPHLKGSDQEKWLNRLEREHDNLRAALTWLSQSQEGAEKGLRFAGALHRFWSIRGYLSEGREYLASVLERTKPFGDSAARGEALLGLGRLAWFQADYSAARPLFEEALRVQRELGNESGIAYSLLNLANVACHQGDYASAKQMNEQSLELFRCLGDEFGVASALGNLGNVASDQGDHDAAWPLYEECRLIQKRLGNKYGFAIATHNLGLAAYNRHNYGLARSLCEECLAVYRELGYKSGTASMLANLGNIALHQEDFENARRLFEECLSLRRDVGDKRGIASSLEEMGAAFAAQFEQERATRLWGAAFELRERIGMAYTSGETERQLQQVDKARSILGSERFEAAWEEGRKLSWEEAVDLALDAKPAMV